MKRNRVRRGARPICSTAVNFILYTTGGTSVATCLAAGLHTVGVLMTLQEPRLLPRDPRDALCHLKCQLMDYVTFHRNRSRQPEERILPKPHVTPTAHSKAHSHRRDWTEQNWTTWELRIASSVQFSSVLCWRWERAFTWAGSATNNTCRRPMLLLTLRIAVPGRRGTSWRMSRKILGSDGVWARRLVDRSKNANFTYPRCIWRFHWGWHHSNINKIFGIRKLESPDYRVVFFAWSHD